MDGNIFVNGEQKLRFQTQTDTCGQGLSSTGLSSLFDRGVTRKLSLKYIILIVHLNIDINAENILTQSLQLAALVH